MHKRIRGRESGFTLLELMFAAGVLAVGLSLLFGSLVSINVMGQVAGGKTTATAFMSSVLEQVRATSRANLFMFTPEIPQVDPGYKLGVALDVLDKAGNPVRLPISNPAVMGNLPKPEDPLTVRATVVYTTPRGHVFSITSTTYNAM